MIELRGVSKTYEARGESHTALSGINLTIEEGDIFGIIGESGAGKSTLVRCINLLERPTSGSVVVNGKDVTSFRGSDLQALRSQVGMIFQNFGLFQQRTALHNITFPLELRGVSKSDALARANELLSVVGLSDKGHRYPSELSGGQQQRVAIARALANEPRVILCDEATSALDSRTTVQILDLLRDINGRLGVTIVLITHSLQVAQHICNKVAVLDSGRVVEQGETAQVFEHPQSEVTRELLSHGTSMRRAQAADGQSGEVA